MQALLNEILDEVRPLIGRGKVADYIPALADVAPAQLGIAVYSNDGELFTAGAADTAFSVQSISKVFSLVQAIDHIVRQRVVQGRRGAVVIAVDVAVEAGLVAVAHIQPGGELPMRS